MRQNPLNTFCSDLSNENHSMKIGFASDGSVSSKHVKNKHGKRKSNSKIVSPYLDGDKAHQLISRVTEKRLVHRKATDFVSSFPLAVGIYKASSDEFKATKKGNKKNKKSVLTLPNDPVPLPQTCTVSDMNDSEYFKESKEERKPRVKKRRPLMTNRKFRSKDIEFYDRDAQYCSQLNIDLDCSSTDLIENFTGIENGSRIKSNKKPIRKSNFKAHDVWTILRNINRFQFRPTPSPSEDSVISVKKKRNNTMGRNSCKDKRFIESCRTEEFAYISSYNLDNNSYSQSSLDRITVIDKQDELEIFQESKKSVEKLKPPPKALKNKRYKKNKVQSTKAITSDINTVSEKERNEEIKQNNNYSRGDNKVQPTKSITTNVNDVSEKDKNVEMKLDNKYSRGDNKLHSTKAITNNINTLPGKDKNEGIIQNEFSRGDDKVHSTKAITNTINGVSQKDKNEGIIQNNKYSIGDIKVNSTKTRNKTIIDVPEKYKNEGTIYNNKYSREDNKAHTTKTIMNDIINVPERDKNEGTIENNKYLRGNIKVHITKAITNNINVVSGKDKNEEMAQNMANNKNLRHNKVYSKKAITGNINSVAKNEEMKQNNKHSRGENTKSVEVHRHNYEEMKKNPIVDVLMQKDCQQNQRRSVVLPIMRKYDLKEDCNIQTVTHDNRQKIKQKIFPDLANDYITDLKNTEFSRGTNDTSTWNMKDIGRMVKLSTETKCTKVSQEQINGITKIIVNKEHSNVSANPVQSKPPLLTVSHSFPRTNSVITGQKQMANVFLKEDGNKSACEQKTKSIPLKEKMMKFISKRHLVRSSDIMKTLNCGFASSKIVAGIDASTETQTNLLKQDKEEIKKATTLKYPWARGKWTSDFIENVIRKIKNGVYYNQEFRDIFKYKSGHKEESTQTEEQLSDHILPIDITSEVHIEMKQDQLKSIPGFDETLSELEIQTFSRHQIVVKHCITNVVVTFDIAVQRDTNNILQLKQSSSCIPLRIEENHTKIFKYKNSIVNAVLPAELCTILPEMMRNIINASTSLRLPKLTTDKVDSQLSAISELTHKSPSLVKPDIAIPIITSPLLKDGQFSETLNDIGSKVKNGNSLIKTIKYCFNVTQLLSNIKKNLLLTCEVNPVTFLISDVNDNSLPKLDLDFPQKKHNYLNQTCMTLQPYMIRDKAIVPSYRRFTLEDIYENITNIRHGLHYYKSIPYMQLTIAFGNSTTMMNTIEHDGVSEKELTAREEIASIFGRNLKYTKNTIKAFHIGQQNLDLTNVAKNKNNEKRKTKTEFCVINNRNRKINFVRLYKKCKSMSNISGASANTMLDKITNLDDFLQALGSTKMLSNVLDGSSERKILSSLAEMKCWMSTITPGQALLVLLLCNKKDTPNLMRYRPVILQGIAVKRITKASELDMEIEVIERENMNKIPQYDGITYVSASVENQDTLLEELCWIAKTTASDYQKTFDESSERLLKSLLEKRKKLNPSYLRVMARYVGLGLLKPTK